MITPQKNLLGKNFFKTLLRKRNFFRLANVLHNADDVETVWQIVKKTRQWFIQDNTRESCQMNQYSRKNMVSKTGMTVLVNMVTTLGRNFGINETISLEEEISESELNLAVEMFTYLTACPDTKLIHLYHHLFNQTSISVKEILLTTANLLEQKPKSYVKKVWLKVAQTLNLQSVNIEQLVIGNNFDKETDIVLGNETINSKKEHLKTLS